MVFQHSKPLKVVSTPDIVFEHKTLKKKKWHSHSWLCARQHTENASTVVSPGVNAIVGYVLDSTLNMSAQ